MTLPAPAAPFEWARAGRRPALVCRPLAEAAAHLFTTRDWIRPGNPPASPEAASADGWDEVARAIDLDPGDLVRVRQVHGAAVHAGRPAVGVQPEADVLVARDGTLGVAVQVADCVPLLLADPRTGAVAAVHAGWRGLAARAPAAAVQALTARHGVRAADLMAACGPSIGACCYEVGADVRDRFAAEVSSGTLDTWFCERPVLWERNPAMPGVPRNGREGRWYFDAWRVVRDQLEEAGLDPCRIFTAGLCTASHPQAFPSYRRDGAAAGRMAAAIRSPAGR